MPPGFAAAAFSVFASFILTALRLVFSGSLYCAAVLASSFISNSHGSMIPPMHTISHKIKLSAICRSRAK